MMYQKLNIQAANQIASELPAIAHMRFYDDSDPEYIIYNIKGGIYRLKDLSPVEATSRQLWLRMRTIDEAYAWLANHYKLHCVNRLTKPSAKNMMNTYTS